MSPALRAQFLAHAVLIHQKNLPKARDVPNQNKGYTGNPARNAFLPRRGEQQFVVLSPMQSQLEVDLAPLLRYGGPWNGFGLKFGTHATLFADMSEVGRKPVADVDHRRGQVFLPQDAS